MVPGKREFDLGYVTIDGLVEGVFELDNSAAPCGTVCDRADLADEAGQFHQDLSVLWSCLRIPAMSIATLGEFTAIVAFVGEQLAHLSRRIHRSPGSVPLVCRFKVL